VNAVAFCYVISLIVTFAQGGKQRIVAAVFRKQRPMPEIIDFSVQYYLKSSLLLGVNGLYSICPVSAIHLAEAEQQPNETMCNKIVDSASILEVEGLLNMSIPPNVERVHQNIRKLKVSVLCSVLCGMLLCVIYAYHVLV
jgi:hypothetical protein